VLGNVALLRESGADRSAEAAHSVSQIERAAIRGGALTQQLLAFGRRQPLQPRIVDAGELVRDAKPMLDRVLGEDVTLSVAVRGTPLFAELDPVRAENAILNLCLNARDAMPDGGRIAIAVERLPGSASEVTITV